LKGFYSSPSELNSFAYLSFKYYSIVINFVNMSKIKNLKKAAERIQKAVKNKERIILYGDSDLDGVTSVIILKEAIKNLGGQIDSVYFPDRETEGYGLNEDALNYLKDKVPALLIILDCSIGNFEEVKLAKKIGFEVIIIDHHEPLKKLPPASIIVNPKQKGDKYPFKEFANVGLVFRLVEVLLKEKLSPGLRNNFLELTAIATIADMVPQTDDNLEFLGEGLASLKETVRPSLKAFWQILGKDSSLQFFAQKVISACHAGGTPNHLNKGYSLLTFTSSKQAEVLIKELLEKAQARQARVKEIAEEIEERDLGDSVVLEGDDSWLVLMLGPAASRVCHSQKKPVFLYSEKNDCCQGAVRTPPGINGVKAMAHCSKFLEAYGGHPQAAGFRIQKENLDKFKTCLIKYFKNV